jgi:hypothetical protein
MTRSTKPPAPAPLAPVAALLLLLLLAAPATAARALKADTTAPGERASDFPLAMDNVPAPLPGGSDAAGGAQAVVDTAAVLQGSDWVGGLGGGAWATEWEGPLATLTRVTAARALKADTAPAAGSEQEAAAPQQDAAPAAPPTNTLWCIEAFDLSSPVTVQAYDFEVSGRAAVPFRAAAPNLVSAHAVTAHGHRPRAIVCTGCRAGAHHPPAAVLPPRSASTTSSPTSLGSLMA